MNKKIVPLLLLSAVLFPLLASADGMVIWPDNNNWRYRDEESQLAYINYEKGIEKMIISVGLKEDTGSGVWLFPVPAKPEKVVIDVVDQFPNWYGSDVFSSAENNLMNVRYGLSITQGYPLLFDRPYVRDGVSTPPMMSVTEMNSLGTAKQDVVVYEHLEKDGITTEIITAKTSFGLYDYLRNKNLNVTEGSIPTLSNYIGKDFTFVVSWLTEPTITVPVDSTTQPLYEYNYYPMPVRANKGVFVAFPTDQAYYPLMPTSVYQSKVIPTTILVKGFVSPKIFKDIEPYTAVNYFVDSYNNRTPQIFYSNQDSDNSTAYTKITINAPSKLLSEDLWIKDKSPAGVNYAFFIYSHPLILFAILFIILSALAGLLAGVICFREARKFNGLWKFLLLGLFNCLTVIGLIIATIFARTKMIKPEDRELFYALQKKGYKLGALRMSDWRKIVFIPLFSVLFLIMSYLLIYILGLGL
jgi:hypothetical protein